MGRRPPNKPSRRRASGRTRASIAAGGGRDGGGDQQAIIFGRVEPVELKEEMERSYLDYSMSTIVARALRSLESEQQISFRIGSALLWSRAF